MWINYYCKSPKVNSLTSYELYFFRHYFYYEIPIGIIEFGDNILLFVTSIINAENDMLYLQSP
jgi:hypothetical protein